MPRAEFNLTARDKLYILLTKNSQKGGGGSFRPFAYTNI
nr:MAG TPA_asm: hypothetical protein [Caudoviricetes sp.]DAM46103.1 MAG TPA: hypothetical protein [Caudoviricetes sp.]